MHTCHSTSKDVQVKLSLVDKVAGKAQALMCKATNNPDRV